MAAVRPASEVRPLTQDELPAVEREVRKTPGRHRERLASQRRGEAVYLFAWIGEAPVGHVLLRCPTAPHGGIAQLEDLGVDKPWRRRGIGTQLVERCEGEALARGFDRIEFGVGIDNDSARSFYAHLGYAELPGQTPYLVRWHAIDEHGEVGEGHELCTTFTKRLRR